MCLVLVNIREKFGFFDYFFLHIFDLFNFFIFLLVDWNLLLDEQGGPNYAENYVDSAIIYTNSTIIKQSTFYAIAHFSKFLQNDCTRIKSTLESTGSSKIETVSFDCIDKIVTVLHNSGEIVLNVKVIDWVY